MDSNLSAQSYTGISKVLFFKKINGNVLRIERRSHYVALPWYQNFWISTNHGLANIALKKRKT